jgi:energy-coupling factor transporter ATP-binding protein EcfA2
MQPKTSKDKVVFSADWHVHPWAAFAEFDEYGVPDRLRDFQRLALDVAGVGKKAEASTLVIAGDLLQVNSPKPMAANTLRQMLGTLCEAYAEVMVISGNHDMDQKSGGFDTIHSGLRAVLPGHPNLSYFDRPQVVKTKSGRSIYFRPWVHDLFDYESFEAADIFVGHGLVVGTRDPFGHMFNSGFKAEELYKRYPLSVIGDIHSGQLMTSQDGSARVLIPGQPIQLNYSSDPNCGLWVCDPADLSLSFVSQSEYPSVAAGENYHRFYSVGDVKDIPAVKGPKDHYKARAARAAVVAPGKPATGAAFTVDLEAVMKREWHALKPEHPALGERLIADLLTAARPNAVKPKRQAVDQLLEWMSVDAFMSVDKAEFDFTAMPGGDVLVIGPNGSGKTTMFEAFYWCYTGKTTKGLEVSKISNNRLKRPAAVTCRTRRPDGVYEVRRSRDPKALLEVWKDGHNISKSSTSDTQDWIYESLLGLDGPEDLLTLLYFSVNASSNFSDFTPSQQFAFLGRLTDSELYEAFRKAAEARLDDLTQARNRDAGSLSTIDGQIEAKEDQLATIVSARAPDTKAKLQEYRDILDDQALPDLAAVRDRVVGAIREAESRVNRVIVEKYHAAVAAGTALTNSLRAAQADQAARLATLEALRKKIAAASGNQCPECGQALHDASLLDRLKAQEEPAERALSDAIEEVNRITPQRPANDSRIEVLKAAKSKTEEAQSAVGRLNTLLTAVTADMSTQAATSQDSRKQFIIEEIEKLRAQRQSLEAGISAAKPDFDTVKLIKDKLTSKNSPVVSKIVAEVFTAMVAGMNDIAGDPSAFSAKAVTGKSFDIETSFRGEQAVTLDGMSVGERRLVDVLMLFSLNQIYCRHFGLSGGLLGMSAYDEVFTYLDPQYLDMAFDAISSSQARLRFVITHDETLMSYYSQVVRVRKEGGFTQYVLPEP